MPRRTVAALIVLVGMAGCAASRDQPEPVSTLTSSAAPTPTVRPSPSKTPSALFPGAEWKRATAGEWSRFDQTMANDGSTCVAVIKDGVLVHSAYWNGGSPTGQQKVYSITKSLTALLAGMESDDGRLDLDGPVSEQITAWQKTDAARVTPRSLLSMTSGRATRDAVDRQMIRYAPDKSQYAVQQPQQHRPGQVWEYDNVATQALEPVLRAAGGDVVELAGRRLLGPLGMADTTWGRDASGHAMTFSGVTSTCQDLARVGHLMLNQGTWDGQQVVSADFVRQATKPSSQLNSAYGLLWWTNASGRVVEVLRQAGFATDKEPYEGRLAPHVPGDAYWAFGYGNQYIAVVPSEGVVAVRLGSRPSTPDRVTFDSFTSGVLDALNGR